ncbi:MAG: right-handed parallel beta-helix repeat-containing protein [Bacteroidales bacterium]|nr:right-handed parallel beta-helix repeat-containing protein [Bacteroidales bacterium]
MRRAYWALASMMMMAGVLVCCDDDEDDGMRKYTFGNGSGSADENVRISENRTLTDRGEGIDYFVDGILNIDGNAVLTIEPGVTIMFSGKNSGIVVTADAGLKMAGTESKPITLTGPDSNRKPGSWDRVAVKSTNKDNIFEYVTFKNGGSDTEDLPGVITIEDGTLSMKNCTIDGSKGNGIVLTNTGAFVDFEENTITNCAGYPVYADYLSMVEPIDAKSKLTGNGKDYVYARGHILDEDFTLDALSVPYLITGTVHVDKGTFSVKEGTEVVMGEREAMIRVNENGAVSMVGSEKKPIVFRGEDKSGKAGQWDNIYCGSDNKSNRLEWVELRNGGGDVSEWSGVLEIYDDAVISIKNCTIDGSLGTGIAIKGRPTLKEFTGNTIRNTKVPILVENLGGIFGLKSGNKYEKNENNYVELRGNLFFDMPSVKINAVDIPYYLTGGLVTYSNQKVEIEAGTKLLVNKDGIILIDQDVTFIANGTAEKPIVFTGLEETPGYWRAIEYHSQKTESVMNHCEISCGGNPNEGGLFAAMLILFDNSALSIKDCKFSKSGGYGAGITSEATARGISSENLTYTDCPKGNVYVQDDAPYIRTELPK